MFVKPRLSEEQSRDCCPGGEWSSNSGKQAGEAIGRAESGFLSASEPGCSLIATEHRHHSRSSVRCQNSRAGQHCGLTLGRAFAEIICGVKTWEITKPIFVSDKVCPVCASGGCLPCACLPLPCLQLSVSSAWSPAQSRLRSQRRLGSCCLGSAGV